MILKYQKRLNTCMKIIALIMLTVVLSGCATVDRIKQLWPRDHDPVLVDRWVSVQMAIEQVNCDSQPTGWERVVEPADHLARLSAFRNDPQAKNLKGLADHARKMSQGGSKTFCNLGKKTADQRLAAAKSAWEGR
jgi:hypothetical protein